MSSAHELFSGIAAFGIQFLRDLVIINRLPEMIGYNLAYFAIGIGLAADTVGPDAVLSQWSFLTVAFLAVMLTKMHASIADVIHDYDLDTQNPEKSRLPVAVDRLTLSISVTVFVVEVVCALVLWGWLAFVTGSLWILCFGATACVLGFVYTYPPRLKECGIYNHLTTTGVDLGCIVVFFAVAGGDLGALRAWAFLGMIFLYSFAYHLLHQAGDTYYDRQYGISTFTQTLGIDTSVLVASMLTALSSAIALMYASFLTGGILLLAALAYLALFVAIRDLRAQAKTDHVAAWFSIGLWATIQNAAVALDLFLSVFFV